MFSMVVRKTNIGTIQLNGGRPRRRCGARRTRARRGGETRTHPTLHAAIRKAPLGARGAACFATAQRRSPTRKGGSSGQPAAVDPVHETDVRNVARSFRRRMTVYEGAERLTNRTEMTALALRMARATDATSPESASRLACVATMSCCRAASLMF